MNSTPSTKQTGDAAEDEALRHLQQAGLRLVQRNYRTPGRGGGEIDLIMRDRDGERGFDQTAAPGVRGAALSHAPARVTTVPF